MSEYDGIFDYALSADGYYALNLGFMIAYGLAAALIIPVTSYLIDPPSAARRVSTIRCVVATVGSRLMNGKSKKSPVYGGGHQAWGRIFWGFVALVLLSLL